MGANVVVRTFACFFEVVGSGFGRHGGGARAQTQCFCLQASSATPGCAGLRHIRGTLEPQLQTCGFYVLENVLVCSVFENQTNLQHFL